MSYVRVSILGATAGGEVWSINPVFDPTFEDEGTIDQAALDAAALAIANLNPGTTQKVFMSTAMSVTGARVEVRHDANDELMALSVATRTTAVAGTSAPRCPPQTAAVISLRTNTPGASGRGRLYWPGMGIAVDGSGKIPSADSTTLLSDTKAYLNSMASALAAAFPLTTFDPAVRSLATHTTPHIVRIQTGNIADTQRRRRDHLPEVYVTLAMP